MASQTKENLQKLLEFLKAEIICKPENQWFVDELRKSLPGGDEEEQINTAPSIAKIEKYLGLDYKLDTSEPMLDYSFIREDAVRECFEADCREMLRYRYGLRGHCIDFGEFCRFAQMQAERLLNLYYRTKGTVAQIRDHIRTHNPKAMGLEKCETLESISYSIKMWAYRHEYADMEPALEILDKVRKVRNDSSHGSVRSAAEVFFQKHYAMLLEAGYPLRTDCTVDWYAIKKDELKRAVYCNTIQNSVEHKHYIDLCWQRQQPFDEVVYALDMLIRHVHGVIGS